MPRKIKIIQSFDMQSLEQITNKWLQEAYDQKRNVSTIKFSTEGENFYIYIIYN